MDLGEKCQTHPEPMKASIVTGVYKVGNGRTHATESWRVIRFDPQSVCQKRHLTRVTRISGEGGPGLPVFLSLAPGGLEKTDGLVSFTEHLLCALINFVYLLALKPTLQGRGFSLQRNLGSKRCQLLFKVLSWVNLRPMASDVQFNSLPCTQRLIKNSAPTQSNS